MTFLSPLRYPGGKRKLADFFRMVVCRNNLVDGEYAEVYAGGASVALSLLYGEFVRQIHINDADPAIAAFWSTILNQPSEFIKRIRGVKICVDEWHRQKAVLDASNPDPADLAFATFFLNRTNRSGIIKGGIIGGKAQDGPWKLDARFNKEELIGRIKKVSRYRSRISVYQCDAADFILGVLPTMSGKSLTYLDPPYYLKGGDLYEHHYHHEDHEQIAALTRRIRLPWIVSYDCTPEIEQMYSGCQDLVYGIHYSAQERYRGREIMFFSPALRVPDVGDPSKLKQRRNRTAAGKLSQTLCS